MSHEPRPSVSLEEEKKNEDDRWLIAGLAVPGCLMLGMGVGFLIDELMGGLFIGLGAGFIVMALSMAIMRSRES